MTRRKTSGPTSERYIEATLAWIAERGGSAQVNLREISRRIGCAHTNAYNYYSSLEDLLWSAYRQALQQYAEAMRAGLDDSLSGQAYLQRLIRNRVEWPLHNPGLHRFISSDPLDPQQIPRDIIETVIEMKRWFVRVLEVLSGEDVRGAELARLVDITLGYLDGEVFNLINGRVLPGDDVAGRVVENIERLFTFLTATSSDGIVLAKQSAEPGALRFPRLEV